MKLKLNLLVVTGAVAACLAPALAAHAADNAPAAGSATAPAATDYSDRAHLKTWTDEKTALRQALRTGEVRDYYAKALSDRGYQVTSVNVDKPTELEYEIVKGAHTYEVEVKFDQGTGRSTKVDVGANMWRADATKAAMEGKTLPPASTYVAGNEAYSDRMHMKAWSGEKKRLEQELGAGHDKGYYPAELTKLGYQVTATNKDKKDYVEYEVVKGTDTYEVQIDFKNEVAKKVNVTSNLWKADSTEKALESNRHSAHS